MENETQRIEKELAALDALIAKTQVQFDELTDKISVGDDVKADRSWHETGARLQILNVKRDRLSIGLENAKAAAVATAKAAAIEKTAALRASIPVNVRKLSATHAARFDALAKEMVAAVTSLQAGFVQVRRDSNIALTATIPNELQRQDACVSIMPSATGEDCAPVLVNFFQRLIEASGLNFQPYLNINQFAISPGNRSTMQEALERTARHLAVCMRVKK
jgi:hypothetical protein